jgi:hypothetical protein
MLAFNFDMSHRLIEHINITLAGQWVYTADITRILQNLYSDVMTSFIRVFLHIRQSHTIKSNLREASTTRMFASLAFRSPIELASPCFKVMPNHNFPLVLL